jgi:hypothetical protein
MTRLASILTPGPFLCAADDAAHQVRRRGGYASAIIGTFGTPWRFPQNQKRRKIMAFYRRFPRDPRAMDPRNSSFDGALLSLLAVFAIGVLIVAGFYLVSPTPTRVADTSPAVTQPTEPTAPPKSRAQQATPTTQHEPRPTQAPIP